VAEVVFRHLERSEGAAKNLNACQREILRFATKKLPCPVILRRASAEESQLHRRREMLRFAQHDGIGRCFFPT